jgi:hypothetical protein
MNRFALFCLNVFVGAVLLAAVFTSLPASARAGTLISCEGISTQQGYRYVGTYCVDFACKYTTTRVFTSYCPYSI